MYSNSLGISFLLSFLITKVKRNGTRCDGATNDKKCHSISNDSINTRHYSDFDCFLLVFYSLCNFVVVTDDQNKYANKSALCESTDIVLSYRPCSRTSIYLNSISRFGRYYLTEEQQQTEAFLICLPKRY